MFISDDIRAMLNRIGGTEVYKQSDEAVKIRGDDQLIKGE